MSMKRQTFGFTLIELIITLAVAAIIIGLTVPSFRNVIRNNQTATETNSLLSAFQLARSEAVKRGGTVSVSATGADFGAGWCVHAGAGCDDANRLSQFDAPRSAVSAGVTSVAFNGRGELTPSGASVQIQVRPQGCASGEANAEREITVGVSGQVRIERKNCS